MAAMPMLRQFCLLLSAVSAACAEPDAPDRVVEPRLTEAALPRGEALLRRTMLDHHNAAREALGLPPLAWDEALVASARRYAFELSQTRRFAHAEQPQGPGRQGENLWMGTRDAYRYDEMIGHWLAERADFTNGVTPQFSRTGRWQDVAHYSEIIWRGTTAVGCATASNSSDDYLVCRYAPAGNVVGQRAY